MINLKKLIIYVFVINLIFSYVNFLYAKPVFIDSFDPPPGFETLDAKQYVRVSLYFMNKYVGLFYAEINQDALTFQSPELILNELHQVRKNSVTRNLLKKPHALNINCQLNRKLPQLDQCQEIKKKPIYLIYNPDKEIVNLYLANEFFTKPFEDDLSYILPSQSKWSYLNKLGAVAFFSNNDNHFSNLFHSLESKYYNFYSNNTISFGNNSIIANATHSNGLHHKAQLRVQDLYARHIEFNKIYTGGYITNLISPFFRSQSILGASIQTTLETIENKENIIASPLVIFVPQAAQVNIFKNDILIFSQYMEAGYQKINTSNFPEGGYKLTIKIGANNVTQQFFTKGFFLPPKKATQYYITSGYLTNDMIYNSDQNQIIPKKINLAILQAGFNKRINQHFAFQSDIMLTSQSSFLDFGPAFFWNDFYIKTSGLITTNLDYGFYSLINKKFNKLNLDLIMTKILYRNKKSEYYFLNNLRDNHSLSISYQLTDYSFIGINASYNRSINQNASYHTGIFYQYDIGNYHGAHVYFNAAYNNDILSGNSYTISINVNYSKQNISGTESLLWQSQTRKKEQQKISKHYVVQGSTTYSQQDNQNLGYYLNEIHVLSPNLSSLSINYDHIGLKNSINAYINYKSESNYRQVINYGGRFTTDLIVNESGALFHGSTINPTAGIMAQVISSNQDPNAKFALLNENNQQIAIIPINSTLFTALPYYADQAYSLVNLSQSDYYIENPVRRIILYPGNIVSYRWNVEKRVIVIGRIIQASKQKPLKNRWIYSKKNGVYSDENGYFQLELPQNTTKLYAEKICKMKLPNLNVAKPYLYLGDIKCY